MTESPRPHPDSTGWTIESTRFELERVVSMALICQPGSGRNQSVVVGVVDCSVRRWMTEGATATAWVDWAVDPTDPEEPVAMPRHFVEAASRLADSLGVVSIYQDRISGSFVARCGDDSVVADPWETQEQLIVDLDSVDLPSESEVSAVVDFGNVLRIGLEYGQLFDMAALREPVEMPAYTVLSVSDGRLSWLSDWTRWGIPKMSGTATAETVGSGTVALLAVSMWRAIRYLQPSDPVTISWDAGDPWIVKLVAGDLGVMCVVKDELMARHEADIQTAFEMCGYETQIGDVEHSFFGPVRLFVKDGRTVAVTVLDPDPSVADFVRLSTRVASIDADLPAVRAEVDRLNETFAGAKLVVRDRGIFLVIDLPAQEEPERYTPSISLLEFYVDRCVGLDEFLPLFSLVD